MKWLYVIASVALFASAYAYETEEEGEARLGYISVASGGDTSLTFNATSIQNAVILGLFLLVLGALLLPLFGINMGGDEGYGEGYGTKQLDTKSQHTKNLLLVMELDMPRGHYCNKLAHSWLN